VSSFFEPRVVEKPFLKRWLLTALQLVLRSPLRFGAAIGLLGALDATALQWLQGVLIERMWMERLGMVSLPFIWAFVASVARGADDSSQTWTAFAGFARARVWMGALASGAFIIGLDCLVHLIFFAFIGRSPHGSYINRPGQLLGTFGAQGALIYWCVGACFLPLLVFQPGLAVTHARQLSMRAVEINGRRLFDELVIVSLLIGLAVGILGQAVEFIRGIGEAAWVVFTGTLNYVAYRDIFERRSGNAPQMSLVPAMAVPRRVIIRQ
jgi:hypothetical protein